ncbi:hypothetical protein [Paraflavitalea speifideaquila]|uniref:hypothetical protein n=1 Tax=Paraflavitalea speifideaquila TaxID=3076558 RepID=UPI0028EC540F|nr:hypothetical protein [Paraflavitalea speifideiaquila]
MKILINYLKPYKWLVFLVLLLAAINIGFSLLDPIIFGKLVNFATYYKDQTQTSTNTFNWHRFLFNNNPWGSFPCYWPPSLWPW